MRSYRVLTVPAAELRGHRWDPGYWDPRLRDPLRDCVVPVAELGDFLGPRGITYGKILPGRRPPAGQGPLYVTQRAVRPTGLDPLACPRIEEGCAWDTPRHRLERGDVLLPRSGVGTLARGVMTVVASDEPAVIDCFTDRISLHGYPPELLVLFLRSAPGWLQIHRLINGVGPPNISFDEIRGLRVPVFPEDEAADLARGHDEVHRLHRAWVERRRILLQRRPAREEINGAARAARGRVTDDTRVPSDWHAGELRRAAEAALRRGVAAVARAVLGRG